MYVKRREKKTKSTVFDTSQKPFSPYEKQIKIFQENLRKPLDKLHEMWYNIRAVGNNPLTIKKEKEGKPL